MAQVIIEICPHEPRASACLMNGAEISTDPDIAQDFADCRASGDCEPACQYVRDAIGCEFRIVARNASGEYENRLATDDEIRATCEAIYFDSETDFTDRDTCATYLIWEAASDLESESD